MISSHYETGKSLPQDLIDKLIKSRTVGQGLFNLRQLFFGKVRCGTRSGPRC